MSIKTFVDNKILKKRKNNIVIYLLKLFIKIVQLTYNLYKLFSLQKYMKFII